MRSTETIQKRAGSGREDNGVLAADGGGDGGRSAGAELQRIEHGGALKWVKVLRGPMPCATAVCSAGKVRSGAFKVGGTRLSTLHMRSPQPYLRRKPRMYFDAQAAPRQPRAQALRDETEHEPNQKGGRGYSAALGTGASARESRWAYAIPLTGAVLAQVVGEGDAELCSGQRCCRRPQRASIILYKRRGIAFRSPRPAPICPLRTTSSTFVTSST